MEIESKGSCFPEARFDPGHIRVIGPKRNNMIGRVKESIRWRDLLWMLVQRDIKVRYRQTLFGVVWAVAVPLLTLMVYWVVFDKLGRMGPDGMPYPLFLFPAMIVWGYFTSSTGRAANALTKDSMILSKVYFPRMLLPIANIVSPLVDFAFGFGILLVILALYQHPPTWRLMLIPAYLSVAIVAATGMGLGLSVMNAHFRDVHHFLPVMLHLWFFCSPVLYGTMDMIPERFQLLYAINPMVLACEGLRSCALGQPISITPTMMLISATSAAVLLVAGSLTFMRLEQTVTDVI